MIFPNALKGIKTIHLAELVTLLLTVCSLGLLVLEELLEEPEAILHPVYWVILVLGLAALALELVGIFLAAKDEPLFRQASVGMIFSLAMSFWVLFIEEGQLLRTVIELFCIIPTIYCSVTVVRGIMCLAEKLEDAALLARRPALIRAVVLLSLGAMSLEFISAFFLHGQERYKTLRAIFHTMILTMELVEVSIFLGCTSQAEHMLHHAEQTKNEEIPNLVQEERI